MMEQGYTDLDALLREVERTTIRFPLPPPGFDPVGAQPEDLARFGIPPKPDPNLQETLSKLWHRLFSGKPTFVEARFSFESLRLQRGFPPRRVAGGTRLQTSLNWSGAFITPRRGRMFTEIYGSWTVPEVSAPVAMSDDEYRSSAWIGLDGQRRYLDSSLPQIGTAHVVSVDAHTDIPSTTTWWQWWLRDHAYPPVTLSLAVEPCHVVIASLIVVGETLVKFIIKNETTGQICSPFIKQAPLATLPNGLSPVQVKVSGATAEWVLERPTIWGSDRLYELPDYGKLEFEGCQAVSALAPRGTGRAQSLFGARLINMYRVGTNPYRTVTISKADRLDAESVTTSYVSLRAVS
jgi:hypothetical protein